MIEEEIYKDVSGYEGLYQVSNFGNVRSLNYNHTGQTRILRPVKDRYGYLLVDICKDGNRKKHRVHRLVAQAFIPNPDNLPEINHKDENKENNVVTNLEYCDRRYNVNHGTRTERMAEARSEEVLQFTLDYVLVKEWSSIAECGRNGFNISCVSDCCNNKYGKKGNVYKGYRWVKKEDYYKLFAT